MATRIGQVAPINDTDANFRLWINEMNNAILAMGWLATSDTGQINFSTVTRPTGGSIYQGYAVYKMNDALQATTAVFMRIDFGTNASTNCPGIKLQVCIGSTNGAGTLTGNLCTQVVTGASGITASSTLYNVYTSGTTSRLTMSLCVWAASSLGFTIVIERDRDTSGVETSLGVNVLVASCGNNTILPTSQFIEAAGGLGAQDTRWYSLVSSQASQAGQGTAGVGTVRTQLGPFRNPMLSVLVYARADFLIQTTASVVVYGAAHTYIFLRPNGQSAMNLNSLNTDCGCALLWE